MKLKSLLLSVFILASCTDQDGAERTLRQAGYKDIEITGYRPFMKSEDDTYSTGFRATSPAGYQVTGAVTGGPFKGNTIRLD